MTKDGLVSGDEVFAAPERFRDVMSQWASGVTIVTTLHDQQRIGITASSFSSLSLHPPLVLVCINRKLYTHEAIHAFGAFAINILDAQHVEWGMRFAGMRPELADRFAGIETTTAVTGCPILGGVVGWLDCTVHTTFPAGDHTIFIGAVRAVGVHGAGDPLLYFRRAWRRLHEDSLIV
jgi:flavin reductase (DIM6/NTAB) family NADH-FMN oxidoreductase RutF